MDIYSGDLLVPRMIILHCSDTEDGPERNDWAAICRYHMAPPPHGRGWSGPGYHYGLDRVDGRYVLFPGRSPHRKGAHCVAERRNHDSLGLCVVGDFDKDPPPLRLMLGVGTILAFLCIAHGIAPEDVRGHREFDPHKTCPGRAWDMDQQRLYVTEALHRLRWLDEPHLAVEEMGLL